MCEEPTTPDLAELVGMQQIQRERERALADLGLKG